MQTEKRKPAFLKRWVLEPRLVQGQALRDCSSRVAGLETLPFLRRDSSASESLVPDALWGEQRRKEKGGRVSADGLPLLRGGKMGRLPSPERFSQVPDVSGGMPQARLCLE